MKRDTQIVSLGRAARAQIKTVNLPVTRASTVVFDTLAELEAATQAMMRGEVATTYGTRGTSGTFALADTIAQLEGGFRAQLYSSGLAAIAGALLAFVKSGDEVLMPDSAYAPTRVLCDNLLARLGVTTTYYDPCIGEGVHALLRDNTRVVYLESPGSHTFEVQDVPAIVAAARARGVVTIMDNAWASPLYFKPFAHGVDVSVLPATKYLSGHSDVLLGVAVANEATWPAIRRVAHELGQCVGGDDAYLVLRGIRTVHVRMPRHFDSGLVVARWLARRPEVARVLHPALASDPGHALWQRDFSGASGLFAIELKTTSPNAVAALCDRREYFKIGYSWGGFESLIVPAKIMRSVRPWSGGALVRLHIGLEDPDDLIRDLERGFEVMNSA